MIDTTNSFWDFSHSSKIDVLKEARHYPIVKRALFDQSTNIEPVNGDWLISGKEEALLIQASSCYLRIALFIYYQLVILF